MLVVDLRPIELERVRDGAGGERRGRPVERLHHRAAVWRTEQRQVNAAGCRGISMMVQSRWTATIRG